MREGRSREGKDRAVIEEGRPVSGVHGGCRLGE